MFFYRASVSLRTNASNPVLYMLVIVELGGMQLRLLEVRFEPHASTTSVIFGEKTQINKNNDL